MKFLRRILLFSALMVIVGCAILLITAYDPSNPTHRRYSSEVVITTGKDKDIGDSGEEVLSKDLRMPINDRQSPRQVICNTRFENQPPPESNTECILYSDNIVNHRRPDFISLEQGIIADSKNRKIWNKSDIEQIREFAIAAEEFNLTLWIYVRQNTVVADDYHEVVESTGGRIIYYFQTEQPYIDPIDFYLLAGIVGGLGIILIWATIPGITVFFISTPQSPKSSIAISPHKSSRKAKQSFDTYDHFMRNASDNARKTLDD